MKGLMGILEKQREQERYREASEETLDGDLPEIVLI